VENSFSAFTLSDLSSNWRDRTGESRAGEQCGQESLHMGSRTSAINKEIWVTHGFSGQREFSESHSLSLFIALLSLFSSP